MVAGAERPEGPITTAVQGLWLVAEKQQAYVDPALRATPDAAGL